LIDPLAVVDPTAEIDPTATIGAFSIIDSGVRIGANSWIGPHVVIRGPTSIGCDNRIYQFASIGEDPQDTKYQGESTRLEIGDRNTIREYATLHRGTVQAEGVTRIGNDNLFMAYIHVAHDCIVADHVIMANAASLGGHVEIEDYAILGGFTIVHQFCRIGAHCFSAMGTAINKDVPPFVMVSGQPAQPYGINSEGMKRRNFSSEQIQQVKRAYRLLYKSSLKLEEATAEIASMVEEAPDVQRYVDFLQQSQRSIVR